MCVCDCVCRIHIITKANKAANNEDAEVKCRMRRWRGVPHDPSRRWRSNGFLPRGKPPALRSLATRKRPQQLQRHLETFPVAAVEVLSAPPSAAMIGRAENALPSPSPLLTDGYCFTVLTPPPPTTLSSSSSFPPFCTPSPFRQLRSPLPLPPTLDPSPTPHSAPSPSPHSAPLPLPVPRAEKPEAR